MIRMQRHGVIHNNLEITGISAYLGLSTEETHKMKGEGERIYELLGTLAFIFGNEPLDSLHIAVRRQTENCSFTLYRSGSVKIADTEYVGNYCGTHVGDAKQARLCLLVYTTIIPALREAYDANVKNGQWSRQHRLEFVNNIGKEILKRVITSLNLPKDLTINELLT